MGAPPKPSSTEDVSLSSSCPLALDVCSHPPTDWLHRFGLKSHKPREALKEVKGCCMAEINTTLHSNFLQLKTNKQKRSRCGKPGNRGLGHNKETQMPSNQPSIHSSINLSIHPSIHSVSQHLLLHGDGRKAIGFFQSCFYFLPSEPYVILPWSFSSIFF